MLRIVYGGLFLASFSAFAQSPSIQKGKLLLLGNTSVNSDHQKPSQLPANSNTLNVFQWQATVGIGYVLSSRWAVGVNVGYDSYNEKAESQSTQLSTSGGAVSTFFTQNSFREKTYTAGIFAQWYQPISERLFLFAQPSALYQTSRNSYEKTSSRNLGDDPIFGTSEQGSDASSGYSLSVRPGLLYLFTPRIAGTLTAGQIAYTAERTSRLGDKIWEREFDLNILPTTLSDVKLGVQFYF